MPRIAVYAGSFDPFTLGHLDITQRAARLFDRLIVAIGENPKKTYLLPFSERAAIIQEACASLGNVEVAPFSGLLVHYCARVEAQAIVRGLRSVTDLEFERPIAQANQDMAPAIETVFLLSSPAVAFLSSSIVKEIAMNGGAVDAYVPPATLRALQRIEASKTIV